MKKSIKAITAGILTGTFLLGGIAAGGGQIEAATLSAKYGATINISNETRILTNIIHTGLSLQGKAKYSHSYVPGKYMDCSGFMYYIFQKNGIDIHTKDDDKQASLGSYVPKSQLKEGDLVFFNANKPKKDITHVGIYIGNGKILDMANTKRNVAISDLNWSWYKNNYVTARRVVK